MIRFQSVSKTFRKRRALHDVSFEVPAGAIFALAGPNGAGKTTALSIAMNILHPDSGRVDVLGVRSTRLKPGDFQNIGYVSESQILPEWMRAGDFLRYCRSFYDNWDELLAGSLVREFRIPEDRRLRELSRGEKMRLALVSSLAYRPELLVMDEPFSGLDVLVREEIVETMLGLAEGMTVLLASHDLADLESFATHVAYVDNGELWFAEELSAVMGRFREVDVLLEQPASAVAGIPEQWLSFEPSGRMVRIVHSAWDPNRSIDEIHARFDGVREIRTNNISLRAVFVALAKSARSKPEAGALP